MELLEWSVMEAHYNLKRVDWYKIWLLLCQQPGSRLKYNFRCLIFNSKVHHNKAICRTHPATLLAQCQGHSWRSNVLTVLIPYLSKRFYVYLNKAAGKNHFGCHPRSRSPLKVRLSTLNSLPKALERFSLNSNVHLNKVICRIHSAAVLSKGQCNP
jgi:hypothetical protein